MLEALLRETDARRRDARCRAAASLDVAADADRLPRRHDVHGDLPRRAVVLATGGQSLPKTGSDGAGFAIAQRLGHTIVAADARARAAAA